MDITSRKDIENVINLFYDKIKTDKTLSFFFTEVIQVNWPKHLAAMTDFWENVLFFTGDYEGNPLETHKSIYQKQKTKLVHFERWLKIFYQTIDKHYKGPNAEKMKTHAKGIAYVMQERLKKENI
ncbi:group III truncated hemoglobin [Pseudopedobacter beijingensis]|uniref:Group III truncated hemoglobin n=1 Tax=Pseudopedobacter beijingensis TaxID=1207056 RepID=A0ABW4IBM8_9SPHI